MEINKDKLSYLENLCKLETSTLFCAFAGIYKWASSQEIAMGLSLSLSIHCCTEKIGWQVTLIVCKAYSYNHILTMIYHLKT